MNIDLSKLTSEEITDIETQLNEIKKKSKKMSVYKVSFCVKFLPDKHKDDFLIDESSFVDYLETNIAQYILDDSNLTRPEDVTDIEVKLL